LDLNKIIGGKPSLKRIKKEQQKTIAATEQSVEKTDENLNFTKVWGRMLIELRAGKYRALYGEASLAESGEIVGDELVVIVPKYSVEVLSNEDNITILEKTIFMLFNKHLKIKVMAKPEIKDENIDKLKKIFGKKLKINE